MSKKNLSQGEPYGEGSVVNGQPIPIPANEPTDETPTANGFDPVAVDPFADIASLRLKQAFTDVVETRKELTTVPVRKPSKLEFFRSHPDPDFHQPFGLINPQNQSQEMFLVHPMFHRVFGSALTMATLHVMINTQGTIFLWPINLGDPDRPNTWLTSATTAMERSRDVWVRLASNGSANAYDVFVANGNLGEPEWPDLRFSEILRLAFKGRFVDGPNHLILQKLRGEVS
jgi:hypothetical protein